MRGTLAKMKMEYVFDKMDEAIIGLSYHCH